MGSYTGDNQARWGAECTWEFSLFFFSFFYIFSRICVYYKYGCLSERQRWQAREIYKKTPTCTYCKHTRTLSSGTHVTQFHHPAILLLADGYDFSLISPTMSKPSWVKTRMPLPSQIPKAPPCNFEWACQNLWSACKLTTCSSDFSHSTGLWYAVTSTDG